MFWITVAILLWALFTVRKEKACTLEQIMK